MLIHAVVFILAQLVGLAWTTGRGPLPGAAPAGLLSAAAVVAFALANLVARSDARTGPRLLLLAALGLLQGWALSAPARAGAAVLDGGLGRLPGFALGLVIGELGLVALAVGTTRWSSGTPRHRRLVVIPAGLLAALAALAWAAARLLAPPLLPG